MKAEIWPDGATWAGSYVGKTTAGGGGTLILTITPTAGNEILLLSYHVGKDDYSGAESITIEHQDAAGEVLCLLDTNAAHDNTDLWGPTLRTADVDTATTLAAVGVPYTPYLISGTDTLVFTTSALAQNEELTVQIRARIRGSVPTVTLTGSGTETLTTTSSVVI